MGWGRDGAEKERVEKGEGGLDLGSRVPSYATDVSCRTSVYKTQTVSLQGDHLSAEPGNADCQGNIAEMSGVTSHQRKLSTAYFKLVIPGKLFPTSSGS